MFTLDVLFNRGMLVAVGSRGRLVEPCVLDRLVELFNPDILIALCNLEEVDDDDTATFGVSISLRNFKTFRTIWATLGDSGGESMGGVGEDWAARSWNDMELDERECDCESDRLRFKLWGEGVEGTEAGIVAVEVAVAMAALGSGFGAAAVSGAGDGEVGSGPRLEVCDESDPNMVAFCVPKIGAGTGSKELCAS